MVSKMYRKEPMTITFCPKCRGICVDGKCLKKAVRIDDLRDPKIEKAIRIFDINPVRRKEIV